MDDFTRQYLATALWSSNDESDESGGDPLDRNFEIEDIDADTIVAAQADCARFRELAGDLLNEGDDEQAAHDFWLTRNGHGAGFWDGDWPEGGDRLTAICKAFGEITLYIGDDGAVYHFSG